MSGNLNNRVLVIDDDIELLNTYRDFLQPDKKNVNKHLEAFAEVAGQEEDLQPNFAVSFVPQGENGVELVYKFLIEDLPFAVAFIDIRMPPGIDGLETAKRIRKLDDRIYIIIVTAYSDRSVEDMQMTLQHDVVLAMKPLTRDEVVQQARNACNRWQEDELLRKQQNSMQQKIGVFTENRWYLKDIISAIPEGIVICTPAGQISYINYAGLKLFGYSTDDLLSKHVASLFADKNIQKLIHGIVENNLKPRHLKRTIQNRHGDRVSVLVSGSALCDSTGNVYSVLLVINNFFEFEKHLKSG